MEKGNPTQCRTVQFFPSPSLKEDQLPGTKKNQKSFAAIINDVNPNSVDLSVMTGTQLDPVVSVKNIAHKDEADSNESYWDWPTMVN